jgi:hypothetical protein
LIVDDFLKAAVSAPVVKIRDFRFTGATVWLLRVVFNCAIMDSFQPRGSRNGSRSDRLWKENGLDSEDNWAGKWAKAMEVVQNLRDTKSEE